MKFCQKEKLALRLLLRIAYDRLAHFRTLTQRLEEA